jgi:hypothetical protein
MEHEQAEECSVQQGKDILQHDYDDSTRSHYLLPKICQITEHFKERETVLAPIFEFNANKIDVNCFFCMPPRRLHRKKDSLKFCRRISKVFLKDFSRSPLKTKLDNFFAQLVETVCEVTGMGIYDLKLLRCFHLKVFAQAWVNFKDSLSYYKNGKISLVTFNEWIALFSNEGFQKFLLSSRLLDELPSVIDFNNKSDSLSSQSFLHIYQKMLYLLFKTSIQSIIFMRMYDDDNNKNIVDVIPNFEHFVCMTLQPSLYKHYNHSKGRFALECCKRCKICMSPTLPVNYYEILIQARASFASATSFYKKQRGDKKNQHDPFAEISEEDTRFLFTFWAAVEEPKL